MPIKNAAPPLAGGPADALPHAGHQLDRRGRENTRTSQSHKVPEGATQTSTRTETARAGESMQQAAAQDTIQKAFTRRQRMSRQETPGRGRCRSEQHTRGPRNTCKNCIPRGLNAPTLSSRQKDVLAGKNKIRQVMCTFDVMLSPRKKINN